MTDEEQKKMQAFAKISQAIVELIEDDESLAKFIEENTTLFFHVLANEVPSFFWDKITGEQVNVLKINHIANRLCFQYAKEK